MVFPAGTRDHTGAAGMPPDPQRIRWDKTLYDGGGDSFPGPIVMPAFLSR